MIQVEYILKLFPNVVRNKIRILKNLLFKFNYGEKRELAKLRGLVRFQKGVTNILGRPLIFCDSLSFAFCFDEIFNKEIYKFQTDNISPYIIDAGANIGLSIIYFKSLYPNSKIIAFEPDLIISDILNKNLISFEIKDVEIVNKALSNSYCKLKFYSDGADGGRIALDSDITNINYVECTRLKDYLFKKVDFLKLDIEGAEILVLEDCRNLLFNVERIFVEYHSFIGQRQNLGKLIDVLENAGFRLFISSPGLTSKNPFIEINVFNNMDDQLNIYGIRE